MGEQENATRNKLGLTHTQTYLASGTFLVAGGADMLAHLGPTGLVVGGIATYVVAKHGPKSLQSVFPELPSGLVSKLSFNAPNAQERTIIQRLFGIYPDESEKRVDGDVVESDVKVIDQKPKQTGNDNQDLPDPYANGAVSIDASSENLIDGQSIDDLAVELGINPDEVNRIRDRIGKLIRYDRHPYAKASDVKKSMNLAPDFNPEVNDLLGLGVLGFGIKGSGKTVMSALFAEQFAKFYIPMVIFDKEGDLLSVLSEAKNGRVAASPESDMDYSSPRIDVTPENAFEVGHEILEEGYQVVFDLSSYMRVDEETGLSTGEMDTETCARVMINIIRGLTSWANEQPRDARVPVLLFLDEAGYWLPESNDLSELVPQTQKELVTAFTNAARMGRKRGLTTMYFAQRISELKKSVMAQNDLYIFGKARLDNDQRRYMEYIVPESLGISETTKFPYQEAKRIISAMGKGEFVVCMPDGTQFMTKFHQRKSVHVSHNPTVEAAMKRYAHPAQPVSTESFSQATMPYVASVEASVERPMSTHQQVAARTVSIDQILALYDTGKIDADLMLELIARLPDANNAAPRQEVPVTPQVSAAAQMPPMEPIPMRRAAGGNGFSRQPFGLGMQEQGQPLSDAEILFQRGLNAFDNGANTLDKLAVDLDISQWDARKLMPRIKAARGIMS